MRKMLSIIGIFGLLFSCQKQSSNPASSSDPKAIFRFTVNGMNDSIVGSATQSSTEGSVIKRVYGSGTNGFTSFYYQLVSYKYIAGTGSQLYISLDFLTTNLIVSSYIYKFGFGLPGYYSSGGVATNLFEVPSFWPNYYSSQGTGDQTVITITKIQNGYADGTYTAKLSNAINTSSITITNGEFKNVKILE